MPGHGPTGRRLTSTLLAATLLTSATIFGAAGATAEPENPQAAPAPAGEAPPPPPEDAPPWGWAPPGDGGQPWGAVAPAPEALPAPQDAPPPEAAPPPPEEAAPPPAEPAPFAWLWGPPEAQLLTADVASEHGMQVKTILVARSITAAFPQINSMIGVRPDGQRWHPSGLAVDIMIPNSGSSEGVALGDQIVAYALRNADRFALQDAIWRGRYYTPGGGARGGYGHYDHVHITTFGGGRPSADERYLRADEDTAGQSAPPQAAPLAEDAPTPEDAPPPPPPWWEQRP